MTKTQTIKEQTIGRYYVELRTFGAGFQVYIAEMLKDEFFPDGYLEICQSTTTASKDYAQKVFNRFLALARSHTRN